jgi:hypothetical protein
LKAAGAQEPDVARLQARSLIQEDLSRSDLLAGQADAFSWHDGTHGFGNVGGQEGDALGRQDSVPVRQRIAGIHPLWRQQRRGIRTRPDQVFGLDRPAICIGDGLRGQVGLGLQRRRQYRAGCLDEPSLSGDDELRQRRQPCQSAFQRDKAGDARICRYAVHAQQGAG